MPRTRKPPLPTTTTTTTTQPTTLQPSPLALANNISATTESAIKSTFLLFASPPPNKLSASKPDQPTDRTLPTTSLLPALSALGHRPSRAEKPTLLSAADPASTGHISYETFLSIAALVMERRGPEERRGEVDEAFELFLKEDRRGQRGFGNKEREGRGVGGGGDGEGEERITIETLRRVAKVLKEDVDEAVLRDMILEANGGAGVRKGVGRGEFEGVMRRCGLLK